MKSSIRADGLYQQKEVGPISSNDFYTVNLLQCYFLCFRIIEPFFSISMAQLQRRCFQNVQV
jgi:hypothetical protein